MTVLIRWATVVVDLLFLNLLWLVGCLTVVGAPAATTAATAVARVMQRGEEPKIAMTFARAFREHGVPATMIGVPWLLFGVFIAVDLLLVREVSVGRTPVFLVLLSVLVIYLATSAFLPCVIVAREDQRKRELVKLAGSVALARPGAALQVLLALGLASVLIVVLPVLVLVLPVLVVHATTFVWRFRVAPLLGAPTLGLPIR